jgi:dihydroorotate dehydrogenase
MYKSIIRPLLFSFAPEKAHNLTFGLIKFIHQIPGVSALTRSMYRKNDKILEREVFGITFPNPVGLAAGFDKDAKLFDELGHYGFGFVEIGTLTPVGQPGNEKPRMFRLPADRGLINRMGFNNGGVEPALKRIQKRRTDIILGGNIGKNKITPNEKAVDDYVASFIKLYNFVDYFVVNVSSPNTPNLRALQDREPLEKLLNTLIAERQTRAIRKPILLKIAPDLSESQLNDIVEITKSTGIDGLIATNTTISRDGLKTDESKIASIGAGGLSGAPLKERSTEVLRYLSKNLPENYPIISVGGIFTAEDAIEKLEAGATLLQVYTGFIYEGPAMVKKINQGIAEYYRAKKA